MSNLRLDIKEPFKRIFCLNKHPKLGYLIEFYAVKIMPNGQFGLNAQKIHTNTQQDFVVSESESKILKIIEETDPEQLAKKFNPIKKSIRTVDFYNRYYDDEIHLKVRAYVEKRLLKILDLLNDEPLFLAKDKNFTHRKLNLVKEQAGILFHFRRNELGTNYFATIKLNGQKVNFSQTDTEIITLEPAWLINGQQVFTFKKSVEGKKILPFLQKKYIHIPKSSEPLHYEKFVKPLLEKYDVYAEGFEINTEHHRAHPVLKINSFTGQNYCIGLFFNYGENQFPYHSQKMVSVTLKHIDDQYFFTRISRNIQWEQKIVDVLEKIGFKMYEGALFINSNPNDNIIGLLNTHQDQLKAGGFVIDQSGIDKRFFIGERNVKINISNENDWFDLRAMVQFGPFSIPFIKLKKHILNGIKEFELPDGSFAIIPDEWFEKYGAILDFSETNQDGLILKKHHFGLLEHLQNSELPSNINDLDWFKNPQAFPLPNYLKAELRHYQLDGYSWMKHLYTQKMGACLADDMGLGKTLQILTLLQSIKEEHTPALGQTNLLGEIIPEKLKTSLVVVPTSLVYNWKNEIEKFTNLSYTIHAGAQRTKDIKQFIGKVDIIITSYGTMRNDIDQLKNIVFEYLILDEAQAIKNPSSQTTICVNKLVGKCKIAMSGTPIENSITDLWSIFNFINPGLLGNYHSFNKKYQESVEKIKDPKLIQDLRLIIHPFMMRRTKEQVATELPPKTEKVIFCDMSPVQKEMYEKTKAMYRNELLLNLNDKSLVKNKLNILNGLISLRQIANHPSMFDKLYDDDSGKFEVLKETLQNVINSGHKVLIFSQFVKHLKLLGQYLIKENIPYYYLDGSVKMAQRQEQVDLFQRGEGKQLFLMQLKTGGVGLNLTAADYVFILDPWWNPASERQAMDRTHRIGQDKPVIVYKFISKDSIEEKILHLQEKKKMIADDILEVDDNNIHKLNIDEIKNLFD
jgi:superfamily II DNA or RNA helicase